MIEYMVRFNTTTIWLHGYYYFVLKDNKMANQSRFVFEIWIDEIWLIIDIF